MKTIRIVVAGFISIFHVAYCVCPDKMWSPPKCDRTCACDWTNTVSCRPSTGECVCRTGFTDKHCSAIEGCLTSDTLCAQGEYCEPTDGGLFTCKCLQGFLRSSVTDRCEPCADVSHGNTCNKTCNCHPENTLMCEKTQGACLCLLGWKGKSCEINIDECEGVTCPFGICKDLHAGYECRCKDGQTMIRGRCLDYRTDFIASKHNPDVGELFDVYILFHLPSLYHVNALMGDDFKSTLIGDESEGECTVSLHKHNERVFGDEAFFNLISSNQPTPVEYQYYSSYKVMFRTEGQKTLTIKPYSATTHALSLNFNVQYKSVSVKDCFENMRIVGNLIKPYPQRSRNYKFRQNYQKLTVTFSKRCTEMPQFQWYYSRLTMFNDWTAPKEHYCTSGKKFDPLNIIDLVYQSGKLDFTDHMSETEIIPMGTLPIGTTLICVSAYIKHDSLLLLTTSFHIKGTFDPPRQEVLIHTITHTSHFKAKFWHPDRPSATIRYTWTCKITKWFRHNQDAHCSFLRNPDCVSCAEMSVSFNRDWHEGYIKVTGKHEFRKAEIEMKITRNFFVNLDIKCHHGCLDQPYPISTELTLEAITNSLDLSIQPVWQVYTGTIEVPPNDVDNMIHGSRTSLLFKTKKNALKPGTLYQIKSCMTSFQLCAVFIYNTETLPTQGHCGLTPNTGKLVTGRFTFECTGSKYHSSKIPLKYRLLQKDVNRDVLIGYSSTGSFPDLTFSKFVDGSVIGGEQVTVDLTLKASTSFGSVSTYNTTYTMTLNDDLDVSDILDPIMDKHRRSNSQENLRRTKDIATTINMDWKGRNITQQNCAFIRQELLSNMNNKVPMALLTVRHKSFVMEAILEREEEILEKGLEDGVDIVTDLIGHIDKFVDDIDGLMGIYKSQIQCLDRLFTVLHDAAKYYHSKAAQKDSNRLRMLEKNKEQSIRLTKALTHLGRFLITLDDNSYGHKHESDRYVSFQLQDVEIYDNPTLKFESSGSKILFGLKGHGQHTHLSLLFQEYILSPYTWAADQVFGDLPLVAIRVYKKDEQKTTAIHTYRYSGTAEVQLKVQDFTALKRESREIPLNLVVNSLTKNITMSSCATLIVTPSVLENTVLEIKSPHGLQMKVHSILDTTSDSFDQESDVDMRTLPASEDFERDYGRNRHLIFLPRISSRRILRENENYRVRVIIEKGQAIGNATLQSNPDDMLKLLFQENRTEIYNTKVVVTAYSMSCKYFDPDRNLRNSVCRMSEKTDLSVLDCRCSNIGAYSASIFLRNSLLDSTDITIEVFDNPLVSFMVAVLWVVFLVFLFWAKKKDKLDGMKNYATILEDNDEGNENVYLVCISTSASSNYTPSANVFMYFKGTISSTRPHVFWDRYKVTYQPGSDDWFVMTTSKDIGDVTSAIVWTFERGPEKEQSWHLLSVYIENMLTKEAWVCRYNAWMSVSSRSDNFTKIPATYESNVLKDKRVQLIKKWSHDLRNKHLWLGALGKSPYNKFTRIRRLVTILTVMQSLLLLNLVYFDLNSITTLYRLEPYRKIHTESVIIGFKSSLYSTLLGLFISFLFNRIVPMTTTDDADSVSSYSSSITSPVDSKDSDGDSSLSQPTTANVQFTDGIRNSRGESMDTDNQYADGNVDGNPGLNDQQDVSQNAGGNVDQKEDSSLSSSSERKGPGREKKVKTRDSEQLEQPSPLKKFPEKTTKKRSSAKPDRPRTFFSIMSHISSSLSSSLSSSQDAATDMGSETEKSSESTDVDEGKKRMSMKERTLSAFYAMRGSYTEWAMDQLLQVPHPRVSSVHSEMRTKRATMITDNTQTKRKPFSLPWWCILFTWPLLFAINVYLSYNLVYYGFSVSYNRSLDWLVAFLVGLLAHLVLYQPLVIILWGYFMVTILGKKYPYYTRGPLQHLEDAKKQIKQYWESTKHGKGKGKRRVVRGKIHVSCSDSISREIVRRLHLESVARQIIRDLIGYSMFIVSALYIIDQDMVVTPRFWITENLRREFLRNLDPNKAINVSTMWHHFDEIMLPVLEPTKSDSIQIENTYLFGTTRLRQVRIKGKQDLCNEVMDRLMAHYSGVVCTQSVTDGTEETRSFDGSWDNPVTTEKGNKSNVLSPYKYWSAQELKHSYYHEGDHGYYSAGGYIKLITPDDHLNVHAQLYSLQHTGWIDQLTRCLFVEFTLYNANFNIISGVRIAFEFVNYGGIYPSASFEASPLFLPKSYAIALAELVSFVCIVYYTRAAYKNIREDGLTYFYNIWNLVEVSILFLTFTALYFMILLHKEKFEVTRQYIQVGDTRYTDFSKVFDLEGTLQLILGFVGALIILKMLKLITFSPFMAKFIKTIQISAPNLTGYLVLTIIGTVLFACSGNILFRTMMREYISVPSSMFAHIRFVLGVPDLQSMFAADWVMGRIFAVLGLGVTKYIIINVFISILRESFGLAHQMRYRDEETTVFYMKNILLRTLGIKH